MNQLKKAISLFLCLALLVQLLPAVTAVEAQPPEAPETEPTDSPPAQWELSAALPGLEAYNGQTLSSLRIIIFDR